MFSRRKNLTVRLYEIMIYCLPFYRLGAITLPWFKIFLAQAVIIVLSLYVFIQQASSPTAIKKILKTPLTIPIMSYFLICIISVGQSAWVPDHPELYPLLNWSGRNIPYIKSITQMLWVTVGIAAYFLTTIVCSTNRLALTNIKTWAYVQILTSFFSMIQLIGNFLDVEAIKKFFKGATIITGTEYSTTGRTAYRVTSVFTEPSHLAVFHVTLIPLAFTLLYTRSRTLKSHERYIFAFAMTASFLCTLSRTTVILSSYLLAIIFFKLLWRSLKKTKRSVRNLIVPFVLILITADFISRFGFDRPFLDIISFQLRTLLDTSNLSNMSRFLSAKAAWQIFLDHPFLGSGVGNYALFLVSVVPVEQLNIAMPIVGNIYLEVLCETGLFGFMTFTWILWAVHSYCRKAIKLTTSHEHQLILESLLYGYYGMLLGFMTFSAFFFPFVWAFIGLMIVYAQYIVHTAAKHSLSSNTATEQPVTAADHELHIVRTL